MSQNHTSAATSINATKLPRIYSAVTFTPREIVLDYGCGKYTDHIRAALPKGVKYLPYDPYNQPREVNEASERKLHHAMRRGKPITVICSNVLNVIDNDDTVACIALDLELIAANADGGRLLVTVYEGDRSGKGRETMPDCYQRNERTREYLPYFSENARIHRGIITAQY